MRLLDANTLEVVEFMDHNVPKYVILSHTWVEGQEVTFQDMQNNKGTERSGYKKSNKHAPWLLGMDMGMPGSIHAVSTRRAALSYQRLSTQ